MRTVHSSQEVLVIDDFLDKQAAQYVWRYVQGEKFEHVHRLGWVNAWRLADGMPLRGPVALSHKTPSDPLAPVYPTDKAIDLVIRAIIEIGNELVPWVGEWSKDWSHFFCRPYIYPVGAGLSWHDDNQHNCTGAFTYYCHPDWNIAWGGELLTASVGTSLRAPPSVPMYQGGEEVLGGHLDNSYENDAVLEEAIGFYILPKPNRLVVMGTGIAHCIKEVHSSAGSNVRVSLQGTFMYPDSQNGKEPS